MDAENINKYQLKIIPNNETHKYFWEIWVNGNIILKSDREYKTENDCKTHLVNLCNAFRYIYADKQIEL